MLYSNREENTDEGDSSPGNVIGSPEETETLINMSPHSTVILLKGQTRVRPFQWKTRRRTKVRKPWRKIPTGKIIQKLKLRPRRIKHQNMDRLSYSRTEFVENQQKRKRFQLRLDKLDRIASGVSKTVDALLALLVPGHEASAKRRRTDRIPLDQTLIAFSLASGIVAAILSI